MAYQIIGDPCYKQIVEQTVEWLNREMRSDYGCFYSALDADSEGEEGRYYCWSRDELKKILGNDFHWAEKYYSINEDGYWEEGKYILLKRKSDHVFAEEMAWSSSDLKNKIAEINTILLFERQKRVPPGLDYKCLTSWNALLISALCQAYNTFDDGAYLAAAEQTGHWILRVQMDKNNQLFHSFAKGKATITGFLEDYACTIDSFIKLYKSSKNSKWLLSAEKLTETVEKEFMHPESKMCYFTNAGNTLIARKMELHDNVMPASNSVMAKNFWIMGHYFNNKDWIGYAQQMLANACEEMEGYGPGHSNWAILYLMELKGAIEISCLEELPHNLNKHPVYPPERVILSYHPEISLDYTPEGKGIYICAKGTCFPPVSSETEYLELLTDL